MMTREERHERGITEEQRFYETMLKCPNVIEITKTEPEKDMSDKQDFIIRFKTIYGIKELTGDVKSPSKNNPRFVNINHTSRDGSIGTLPLSKSDLIVVRGLYDDLGKLNPPKEVYYFITKDNVWNTITPDMYREASDGSCYHNIPIYSDIPGRMSGGGLAVKRSFYIDMDRNLQISRFDLYNKILR